MAETNNQTTDSQLSMGDHELLMRLAKAQKTAGVHRRIIAYVEVLILVLMVAAMLIIGPKLIKLTDEMANTLERINTLADKAEPAIDGMAQLDYETLNESINTLNQSVDDFSVFVSKLSSFGGLFR